MSTEVLIPNDLWEEDDEAVITSWLVSDGASVSEGAKHGIRQAVVAAECRGGPHVNWVLQRL